MRAHPLAVLLAGVLEGLDREVERQGWRQMDLPPVGPRTCLGTIECEGDAHEDRDDDDTEPAQSRRPGSGPGRKRAQHRGTAARKGRRVRRDSGHEPQGLIS